MYNMNMEVMEKKLYAACLKGDLDMLEALMKEDELILAQLSLSSCFNKTPLHLACMLGHFEFAKSLLSYMPEFASRLDSQARSPLHLASANGYADIVQMLLAHDHKSMCQVRDEDGRTPLHLAVMNGQHECVRELMNFNSEYAQAEMPVLLHLCVMYNRLNVLILILDQWNGNISNIRYDNGNTVLHSATALKRLQIIKYLVTSRKNEVDVSIVNDDGLTALGIVEQMPKDAKTIEIKELLLSTAATDHNYIQEEAPANATVSKSKQVVKKKHCFTTFQKKLGERDHESLLIAATVIAAMAYQAAINPPGGVAGVDALTTELNAPVPSLYLEPGDSLLAYFFSRESNRFWISNTISFVFSLIIIFIFVSGATVKQRFFTWIIRGAMWITLTSMTVTYVYAVLATTPSEMQHNRLDAVMFACIAWFLVVFITWLVVIYRILRFIVRMIIIPKRSTSLRKKKTSDQFTASSSTPTINVV